MLAAVESGNAKELAELMRQDPGFDVNMGLDDGGSTLLHFACEGSDSRSAVIPLLLAHPDIDVNGKTRYGSTPLIWACVNGRTSCVRLLLEDSRVNPNEPGNDRSTPLRYAAYFGHVDVIKWWIVSGREMDLGKPGDVDKTDAIGVAQLLGLTEMVTLLERFKENPDDTRRHVRQEMGWYDALAAEMFALVVFVSDGLLQIKATTPSPAARFFNIARRLPLELQMVLCFRLVGSDKEIIHSKDSEVAFKELARRLW